MARLAELLARQGAGAGGPQDLRIDSLLTTSAATVALVEEIENAGPFGAAAPAPRFAFANVAVSARRIGDSHLKLTLSDGTGPGAGCHRLRCLRRPAWPGAGERRATAAFTWRASWS